MEPKVISERGWGGVFYFGVYNAPLLPYAFGMKLKWNFEEGKNFTYWALMEMSDSERPDEVFQAVERFLFSGVYGGGALIDVGAVYFEHDFEWEKARALFNKFPPTPAAQFEMDPQGRLQATGVSDLGMQMFWMLGILFPEFPDEIEEADTWEFPVYAEVGAQFPVEQSLLITLLDIENSTGSARAQFGMNLLLLPEQRDGAVFSLGDETIKIKWNGVGNASFDLNKGCFMTMDFQMVKTTVVENTAKGSYDKSKQMIGYQIRHQK